MATEIIEKKVYGGSIVIEFLPNSHRYRIKGSKTYLPSVTGITGLLDKSGPLMGWAVRCTTNYLEIAVGGVLGESLSRTEVLALIEESKSKYKEIRDEAADIGTQVHDWAMEYALRVGTGDEAPDVPEDADDRVKNGISAFLKWVEEYNVEFLAVEQLVYSKQFDFVGHYDVLAKVDGELCVIDYKTGAGVYNEHRYQLSAYVSAHNEEYPDNQASAAIIAHFNKETGAFSAIRLSYDALAEDARAFGALRILKEREKELNCDRSWKN